MTITRANVATYLHTQFSALAASIGQVASDASATGYGPDIDLALRKLGVARADLATATVDDGQEEAVNTLAEYYALRRIWRQLGDRVTHSMGQTSFNFADQYKAVKDMLDDAQGRVTALGFDVTGDAWSTGYMLLDWLEPEEVV